MALPIVDGSLVKGRSCGECNACCVHLEIDQPATIAHAPHIPCSRLCKDGCSEYQSRPMTCVAYRCMWLEGFGGDEHRPDKVGVIFHVNSQMTMGVMLDYVAANEAVSGALEIGQPARKIAEEMGFQIPVILTMYDGSRQQIVPLDFTLAKAGQG